MYKVFLMNNHFDCGVIYILHQLYIYQTVVQVHIIFKNHRHLIILYHKSLLTLQFKLLEKHF